MRLLAIVGCLAACAGPTRLSLTPREALTAEDYDDVLDDWTQSDEIYDSVDSVMFVYATFHSPEFRKTFLLRYTEVYGAGSEEARALTLADAEAEHYHEFFVSVSTNDTKWNDLHQGAQSIWRITLRGEGDDSVEGEATRVKPNANVRRIYPYITDFARTYRIRFPLTGVDGKPIITRHSSDFTVRIASALGAAEMTWYLKP